MLFFFFKQKTAYELRISDWSSDVCSSDLSAGRGRRSGRASAGGARPPTPAPAPQSVALELRAQREPALLGVAHLSLDRVQLVAEAVQRSVIGAGGCVLPVARELGGLPLEPGALLLGVLDQAAQRAGRSPAHGPRGRLAADIGHAAA